MRNALTMSTLAATAVLAAPLPPGGSDLIGSTAALSDSVAALSKRTDVRITDATAAPENIGKAVRIQTLKRPRRDHMIQLRIPTQGRLAKGDVALFSFWARGVEGTDEAGEVRLRIYVQPTQKPFRKELDRKLTLTSKWTHYCFPLRVAHRTYKAGEAAVFIAVGYEPQTLEIAAVQAVNYGRKHALSTLPETVQPVTYPERAPDAAWRAEADARIEAHRKGDLVIAVTADGLPVAGAEVHVQMQRHAYTFGSAVVAAQIARDDADGDRYRQIVEEQYNKIVFENDLKYGPWQLGAKRSHAVFNHNHLFKAFDWLAERGIAIRGHTLVWGPIRKERDYWNGLFLNETPEKAREQLFAYIEQKLSATREHVREWDVLNHPVAGFGDKGHRIDRIYGREIYRDAIQLARRLDSGMEVYVNEGQIMPGRGACVGKYAELIKWLQANGATPDGIGFMCHFGHTSLAAPTVLYERLETFADLGCALLATELDINVKDRECQADYMRDFLTIWFSHPKTVGVIMWGFWEGRHWRPDCALYTQDWTERPVGAAWRQMLFEKWWTDEKRTSDAAGQVSVRGYLGDYRLRVTHQGRTVTRELTLLRDGSAATIDLGSAQK